MARFLFSTEDWNQVRRTWQSVAIMFSQALIFFIIASSALSIPWTGPPDDSVKIKEFSYKGNGCRQGGLVPYLRASGSELLVTLHDSFSPESCSSTPPFEVRQNCRLELVISVPSGFAFSILAEEIRGDNLRNSETGAQVWYKDTFRFNGSTDNVGSQRVQ